MATRAIHTVFTVGGENTYREAVRRINAVIKELNSEMELTRERFAGQEDSYTALFEKQQQMQRMYQAQNELAGIYAERLKLVQDSTDKLNTYSEELRDTLGQIQAALHNTAKTSAGYDELAREAEDVEEELRRVETQMGKNATKALELETGINKAHTEMEKLGRELEEIDPLVDEAARSVDGYAQSMRETADGAQEMRDRTREALDAIAAAAAAAGIDEAFTRILDVIRDCSEAAVQFEADITGVFKTIDATAAEEEAITEGIRELSTRLPATTTEIAAVAEAAGQLGIATGDILKFTEVMIRMGTSTNLSSEEAAVNLAKLATIMGVSADDYERMGSAVVELGNRFATTEQEILEMATRMAASGDLVGMTADEVFAIAAAESSVGMEADAGGSAMQKLFSKMQLSTSEARNAYHALQDMGISISELEAAQASGELEKLAASSGVAEEELSTLAEAVLRTNDYAAVAGMTAAEFGRLWEEDAAAGLNAFIEGLARVQEDGGDAIGILSDMGLTEIRLSRAIMTLATSDGILKNALEASSEAWTENIALAEESERRYETAESKITIMNNALALTKQAVGADFMTALAPAVEKVTELAVGAADAAEASPAMATGLAGIGGALGGLAGLTTVAGGIKLVSAALGIFGTAAGPVAAGVAILAGLGSAVAVYHANATALTEDAETLVTANDSLLDAVRRASEAFDAYGITSGENSRQVEILTDKMTALSDATQKTDADKVVLTQYVETLNGLLPGLGLTFDEVTGKVNLSREAILDFSKAAAEAAEQEALREYISELTDKEVDLEVQMMLTNGQIREAEERYAEAKKKLDTYTEGQTNFQKALNYTNPEFLKYKAAAEAAENEVSTLKESNAALETALQNVQTELKNAKGVLEEYQRELSGTSGTAREAGSAVGKEFVAGLEDGIKDMIPAAERMAMQSAASIARAMREELDIHSPSGVAYEIMEDYGEGAVLGLKSKAAAIREAGLALTKPLSGSGDIYSQIMKGNAIMQSTIAEEQRTAAVISAQTGRAYSGRSEQVVNNYYQVDVHTREIRELEDIAAAAQRKRVEIRMKPVEVR